MDYYRNFDFGEAKKLIMLALNEDTGAGDITSKLLIPANSKSKAELLVKENGIISGLKIFEFVFDIIDNDIKIKFFTKDGAKVRKGQVIGTLSGNTKNLLKGERVSLNILQRMSGIATLTGILKKKLDNKKIKLIDTRKTTPNFRLFEKLAVRTGGGENHRTGLFDMILIKDNHIEANGGISNTLKKLRKNENNIDAPAEIEVKNIAELKAVIEEGKGIIDRVMLDNFPFPDILKAVKLNKGLFEIEVSGGVNRRNIGKYGKIKGIDFISAGMLTHSAASLDISMNFIT